MKCNEERLRVCKRWKENVFVQTGKEQHKDKYKIKQ